MPGGASVLSAWAWPGLKDSSRHPDFLCFLSSTRSLGGSQCSHHLLTVFVCVFRGNLRPRWQLKTVCAAAELSQRASSQAKWTKGSPTQAYVCYLLVWPAQMFARSCCKLNHWNGALTNNLHKRLLLSVSFQCPADGVLQCVILPEAFEICHGVLKRKRWSNLSSWKGSGVRKRGDLSMCYWKVLLLLLQKGLAASLSNTAWELSVYRVWLGADTRLGREVWRQTGRKMLGS